LILVVAGTQDGRILAETLADSGIQVTVSVASSYGRQLANNSRYQVREGSLDGDGFIALFSRLGVRGVIDASHPYAANVSATLIAACRERSIPYLRYERSQAALPVYEKLRVVENAQTAATVAAGLGKVVFLTTGSRTLACYKQAADQVEARLIVRVLPEPQVLQEALALGILPRDIVAMQGPFSVETNEALIRQFGADVLVTKNSGKIGGTDAKFQAAIRQNIWLVVIDKPALDYGTIVSNAAEALNWTKEVL
jgi:precorrin-6A/cobalt-precorrin-6A reductase